MLLGLRGRRLGYGSKVVNLEEVHGSLLELVWQEHREELVAVADLVLYSLEDLNLNEFCTRVRYLLLDLCQRDVMAFDGLALDLRSQ